MASSVPQEICGFTLQPDVTNGKPDENIDLTEWHKQSEITCCWRESWGDSDRCIWHAEDKSKPREELENARSDIKECLDGAILKGIDFGRNFSFLKCRLRNANFSNATIPEADFSGSDLRHADFSDAVLQGSNFSETYLMGTDFSKSDLFSSIFTRAFVGDSTWLPPIEYIFYGSSTIDHPRLNPWNLGNRSRIVDRRERLLPFSGVVDFSGANLRSADLSRIIPWGLDFKNIEFLRNANLRDANISNLPLRGANLSNMDFRGADLSGIDLQFANLSESTLRDSNMQGTNLTRADLRRADVRRTNLTNATLDATNFSEAFLRGANLSDQSLKDSNFIGANLREAILTGIDFHDATLQNTNLRDSHLSDSDLEGAILSRSDLRNADFSKAILREAEIIMADARGATFLETRLVGADFSNTNFSNCNLAEARFQGAKAVSTNLRDSSLRNSDFSGADLSGVAINYTDLSDITFDEATIFGSRSAWEAEADHQAEMALSWISRFPAAIRALGRRNSSPDLLEQAALQYRATQRLLRENDLEQMPELAVRVKHAQRKRALAEGNIRKWLSYAVYRWPLGYGERPQNVIATSLAVIVSGMFLYPKWGLRNIALGGTVVQYPSKLAAYDLPQLFSTFGQSFYFSTITFTTVGYGDLQPIGWAQTVATIESFIGALLMAFLVFVLGRRATW